MKHASRNTVSRLPHLSDRSSGSKALVVQDDLDRVSGVFAPSAIRSHKKPLSASTNRMFAAVLFGLFIIMLLLSFLVGINVYRALNTMAESESVQRLEQSFLANTVHSNDMIGAVEVGEGPEGKALVLRETIDGSSSYETRIYSSDGSIVQEYSLAGSPYVPEKAIKLIDSTRFDFSYENGLLTIYTDGGSVDVALRSAKGA